MKQTKCPYKGDLCIDYGKCEECSWGKLIARYEEKIAKLKKRLVDTERALAVQVTLRQEAEFLNTVAPSLPKGFLQVRGVVDKSSMEFDNFDYSKAVKPSDPNDRRF